MAQCWQSEDASSPAFRPPLASSSSCKPRVVGGNWDLGRRSRSALDFLGVNGAENGEEEWL